ncbi:CLUMA_CG003087, isoform A [Clunio marinus]|uniref:CLUMA_CG003087, isoform A n=1 Tax=Clunio marinus TaxID=568069 RepID=A0A1J1HMN8_9DIPT|nr:CLUMA_CG003087, isoform A [Clunio marinus]
MLCADCCRLTLLKRLLESNCVISRVAFHQVKASFLQNLKSFHLYGVSVLIVKLQELHSSSRLEGNKRPNW